MAQRIALKGETALICHQTTVEECLSLDVHWLYRNGMLTPGDHDVTWQEYSGNSRGRIRMSFIEEALWVSYTWSDGTGSSESIRYPVPVTWTPCTFGGNRPWFICPGRGCGRRVGKLYLNGRYFLCRHCHNLTYRSYLERWHHRRPGSWLEAL